MAENDVQVRLDKGVSVQFKPDEPRHIEHGYAVEKLKAGALRTGPHRAGSGCEREPSGLCLPQRKRCQSLHIRWFRFQPDAKAINYAA